MTRASLVLVWIAVAIMALGALASWDERREQAAAIADFGAEQTRLASSVARAIGDVPAADEATLARWLGAFETPGSVRVLLAPHDGPFVTSTDPPLPPELGVFLATAARDQAATRLSHEQAAALGLPPRLALAGFARDRARDRTLAVVATALSQRDRQIRAEWRITLGFLLASALVVAFGTLAMRKQRAELSLVQELAVADAVRTRDERLVRADKLATMGALATGVAHEVSTPLGVIVGRAEQIERAVREGSDVSVLDRERLHKAATAIIAQAERITRIIRGLLDLARGTSPPREEVTAGELARTAAELVEHRFRAADIALDLRLDEEAARAVISCDPRLFEQVLVNLLLNACEASPRDTRVELALASASGGGSEVRFCVEDEGEGISAEAARRATEPFFTTKGARGTGLGLSIAREIVLHHRGELSIGARDTGRGTRASVTVPAAALVAAPSASALASGA